MPDFKLKEAKTLEYDRPAIEQGYTDQTLYVNISDSEITISRWTLKQRKRLSVAKVMICGCCGMPFSQKQSGMTLKMRSVLRPVRWGELPLIRDRGKVLSPPFRLQRPL